MGLFIRLLLLVMIVKSQTELQVASSGNQKTFSSEQDAISKIDEMKSMVLNYLELVYAELKTTKYQMEELKVTVTDYQETASTEIGEIVASELRNTTHQLKDTVRQVEELQVTVRGNQEMVTSELQGLRRQLEELQVSVSALVEFIHDTSPMNQARTADATERTATTETVTESPTAILPTFYTEPEDAYIIKNRPVTLSCKAQPVNQLYFKCNGVWMDTSRLEHHETFDDVEEQLVDISISITKEDVEQYFGVEDFNCQCVGYVNEIPHESREGYVRIAYLKKLFEQEPFGKQAEPQQSIELLCRPPQGVPDPEVYWEKDRVRIDKSDDHYIQTQQSLIVNQLTISDTGNYTCVAENLATRRESEMAQVLVYDTSPLNQGHTADATERTATTEAVSLPKDCSEILGRGVSMSGVYTVQPLDSGEAFQVYCDMETDGGGWTVFQRRKDGSVDFYLDFANYSRGFGNLEGEFWLGTDILHRMTAQGVYELRVDLSDFEHESRYAVYDSFSIADVSDNYRLTLGSYSGTAGDSLSWHNNHHFSTKDRDNDTYYGSCAKVHHGAWWYDYCLHSSLNGAYFREDMAEFGRGVIWKSWHGVDYSLKTSEMKIRPTP